MNKQNIDAFKKNPKVHDCMTVIKTIGAELLILCIVCTILYGSNFKLKLIPTVQVISPISETK